MRAIIVILALLVIITGGIGYYSYTFYVEINLLNEQLAAYQTEQSDRLEAVSEDLQQEIRSGLGSLGDSISRLEDDVDALDEGLGDVRDNVAGVEDSVNTISSQVDTLDDRITTTEENIMESTITADDIYQRVIETTVRITDGERLIGSGFVYDIYGDVVTAHHVIEDLSPIYVVTYDGRISEAVVVGSSSFADVAVINLLDNPVIEPAPLGDSSLLSPGEPVIAIGSPGDSDIALGLRDTITLGVISQVNRFVNVEGNSVANLVQVDASVNPGNSGCPLFNNAGEIIGMVIAGIDPALGDGLNFAVAINKVKRVAASIIDTGSFAYPWVGLNIADLTPEYADEHHLDTIDGVLVVGVTSGSPGDKAGFRTNDIIITVDGVPVRDIAELVSYLGEYNSPGDELTFDVIRGGETRQLLVVVGERES